MRDQALKKLGAIQWNPAQQRDQLDLPGSQQSADSGDSSSGSKQRQKEKAAQQALTPNFKLGQGRIALLAQGKGIAVIAPVPDPATGALKITATGSREFAVEAANTFAKTLQQYLDSLGTQRYDAKIAGLQQDVTLAQEQYDGFGARIALEPDPVRRNQLVLEQADSGHERDQALADIAALSAAGAARSELRHLRARLAVTDRDDLRAGREHAQLVAAARRRRGHRSARRPRAPRPDGAARRAGP